MALIQRSATASTQPRTGQTPSQATISKLKSAMGDPTKTLYGVSLGGSDDSKYRLAGYPSVNIPKTSTIFGFKPKGYYNSQESFTEQNESIKVILNKTINSWTPKSGAYFESMLSLSLQKGYGDYASGRNKDRVKGELDAERQRLKDVQLSAHVEGIFVRLQNGEIVAPDYFMRDINRVQGGISSPTEFLMVYQMMVKNGTIHKPIIVEKPIPVDIPTPTPTPTPPAITSSLPIIPIIIIAVIVGFFLLRRRA